jgi:hypothetical protein
VGRHLFSRDLLHLVGCFHLRKPLLQRFPCAPGKLPADVDLAQQPVDLAASRSEEALDVSERCQAPNESVRVDTLSVVAMFVETGV